MDIKLNFINNSNDTNNSQVVVFQKNAATGSFDEHAVAWQVIQSGGQGGSRPFTYPLAAAEAATPAQETQVLNSLPKGAINASLWVGVASQGGQGEVMNPAMLPSTHTELSLHGVVSADIVMTGGGSGPDAAPFQFTLENVVKA